jgi:hypothetical protein
MPGWAVAVLILVVYIVLTQWVLPKFGVAT